MGKRTRRRLTGATCTLLAAAFAACGGTGAQVLPPGPGDGSTGPADGAPPGDAGVPPDGPGPEASGMDGTVRDAADASQDGPAASGALLLLGTVVTPDTSFDGQVLVVGDTITCAAAGTGCAAQATAARALTIDTQGVIAPGLIDTHNHIFYDIHDENDWTPSKLYANHNQWTAEPRYAAMLDVVQCLASETGKPTWCPATYASGGDLRCEMDKWGELKAIVSGTTSVVGLSGTSAKCFDSLARSIDTQYNGLGSTADPVYTSALFPPSSPDGACAAIASGTGKAYLIHCGEGLPTDSTASSEFGKLAALTKSVPGCFMNQATTVTHGVAFTPAQFQTMHSSGMKLTWSPQSNVSLYGATADIPSALSAGVTIALGPDWSMGGSVNMLDEMRFANGWDDAHFGNKLSSKDLVVMATKNGGAVTSYGDRIGQIAAGYLADLFVVPKAGADGYDAILAASPKEVRLTMVGGQVLYGDPALLSARSTGLPPCETIDVCGASKFICVAQASTSDKLNQTFADVKGVLEAALTDLDTTSKGDASVPWTFAPLAQLVRCR